MKKTFICASLLLGAFAVVSCSNDSPGAEAEGTKVMIDLSTDLSFSGTRSADTSSCLTQLVYGIDDNADN